MRHTVYRAADVHLELAGVCSESEYPIAAGTQHERGFSAILWVLDEWFDLSLQRSFRRACQGDCDWHRFCAADISGVSDVYGTLQL